MGTYTVEFEQCFVDLSQCVTSNFDVIILDCAITSITVTDFASFDGVTTPIYIDFGTYILAYPTFIQVPACNFAVESYTA